MSRPLISLPHPNLGFFSTGRSDQRLRATWRHHRHHLQMQGARSDPRCKLCLDHHGSFRPTTLRPSVPGHGSTPRFASSRPSPGKAFANELISKRLTMPNDDAQLAPKSILVAVSDRPDLESAFVQ